MSRPKRKSRTKIEKDMLARKQQRAPSARRLFFYGGVVAGLALLVVAAYALTIPGGSIYWGSGSGEIPQTPAVVKIGVPAPEIAFTTVDGTQRRLSEFRGRPVMLWLFATWCPTCVAGTYAVVERFDRLKRSGIQIIQLKLYNNLGYPGPSVEEFAGRYAGAMAPSPNWLWGEASQKGSFTYDPRGYPDIYFLIGKDGILQDIQPAPHVTMNKILAFARSVVSSAVASDAGKETPR